MTRWKLTLAYDGTPYHGWQVQPGLPTVQGALAEALHRITGETTLPQGSGRTDAGVHALAQVASCSLAAPIPPANLLRALNRCLPASIRVIAAEPAPASFHARHSAIRKTYEYRIFQLYSEGNTLRDLDSYICPPTLAPYVWPCPWPLSLDALNQAACKVLGTHDFTSFAATDPDQSTRCNEAGCPDAMSGCADAALAHTRTIHRSEWQARDGLLIYTVAGSGFLHHMVRNLVGTFVQAGSHRLSPDAIPALLAARNRAAAGPTAPATGLFLVSAEYEAGPSNP
jgi:tRNA pseudouridine38-40 synthase